MNEKMRKKYDLIAKATGILVGLLLIIGISYAVFRTVEYGDKDNTIQAGKLDVRVENESGEITLAQALPITDEEGLSQTPYTFDVVNYGIEAMYDMYLELEEDSNMPLNRIKYYLTKTTDNNEEVITEQAGRLADLIEKEKKGKVLIPIDLNDSILVDHPVSYKLYLWLDYNATKEEAANKLFKAKIRVDASQVVERAVELIKKQDISENHDGFIYATFYDDGTLVINGKGKLVSNLADTDLLVLPTILDDYRGMLELMGYDTTNINSLKDYHDYKEELGLTYYDLEDAYYIYSERKILKEMGYTDYESIVDYDSEESYLISKGLIDEDWNPLNEQGEIFLDKLDVIWDNFNVETYVPTNVEIPEGITNIPEGLYTGNEDLVETNYNVSIGKWHIFEIYMK